MTLFEFSLHPNDHLSLLEAAHVHLVLLPLLPSQCACCWFDSEAEETQSALFLPMLSEHRYFHRLEGGHVHTRSEGGSG